MNIWNAVRGEFLRGVLICTFLTFLCCSIQAAQPYQPVQPDPVLESWRWRSFPELKGLGLRCMAEATDGAMWFGVDDGAVRYDGIHWTTFTQADGLLGAPVTKLCAASDGSVYAGTEIGVSRFVDGVWHRMFPAEGDLRWFIFDLMAASDGSLWAGTPRGALCLSPSGATLYTTEAIQTALIDSGAAVQFVTVPEHVIPAHGDFSFLITFSKAPCMGRGMGLCGLDRPWTMIRIAATSAG